jgi:cell division septum initiation protein DivIVA
MALGTRSPAGGHDGRVSTSEEPTAGAPGTHSTEGSAEDSDRLGPEFTRLTAKVVGRAREGAEDIWAEAQSVRQEEPSVLRRTAVSGLAGLLKAGDVIAASAREVAAQARAAQASARAAASAQSEDASGSQDVTSSQPDTTGKMSPTAGVDGLRPS